MALFLLQKFLANTQERSEILVISRILTLVLILLPSSVLAWAREGHEIVA